MRKQLIIIGAGQLGREVFAWAKHITLHSSNHTSWDIKGFLDSRVNILDNFSYSIPIIDSVEHYIPKEQDIFICAIGEPEARKKYSQLIQNKGGTFATLVHPTVVLGDNVALGQGVLLCPYSVVSSDSHLGDFVIVNIHSTVAHDCRIGDWCQISLNCSLNGGVVLGESVFMGSNSTILPRIEIASGAIIGAGSVVTRNVSAYHTVAGVPARIIHDTGRS
jgi:sugar O-acyltransferase (sialic acid O-acetyltransferase NeuD family)